MHVPTLCGRDDKQNRSARRNRLWTQSLFWALGVHVAHIVIDGVVNGDIVQGRFGRYIDSLGEDGTLAPDTIAEAF